MSATCAGLGCSAESSLARLYADNGCLSEGLSHKLWLIAQECDLDPKPCSAVGSSCVDLLSQVEAALAQQQADEEQQRKAWERLEVSHTILFVCCHNAEHLLLACFAKCTPDLALRGTNQW